MVSCKFVVFTRWRWWWSIIWSRLHAVGRSGPLSLSLYHCIGLVFWADDELRYIINSDDETTNPRVASANYGDQKTRPTMKTLSTAASDWRELTDCSVLASCTFDSESKTQYRLIRVSLRTSELEQNQPTDRKLSSLCTMVDPVVKLCCSSSDTARHTVSFRHGRHRSIYNSIRQ